MAYTPYNPYAAYQGYYQPLPDARPIQQPTQQPMPTPMQSPMQAQGQSFAWVNNENEAREWVVLPGQSMLLMSRNDSTFWIKVTDQSGMPQPLRAFDYSERINGALQSQSATVIDYATRGELQALAARVDEIASRKCACDKRKEDVENGQVDL